MPITKTAKRALRGSIKKESMNKKTLMDLEIALRMAKKSKKGKDIDKAFSLSDRAAKKHVIPKNKASRIKSFLSRLSAKKPVKSAQAPKKTKKKVVKK